MVLVVAVLLAGPTLLAFLAGEMPFEATVVRALAALAVSWVLSMLVVVVFRAMAVPSDSTALTAEADPLNPDFRSS